MARVLFNPTERQTELLRASGSLNKEEYMKNTAEIAKALELPLREGVRDGDILDGIFETEVLNGAPPEYPLHYLAPGTEKEFVAFSIPGHGYIPQRHIEGDYVMLSTYGIGNGIDWNLKYAKNARWPVVTDAMETFKAGFTKKLNDDGWSTLITAGADRNIVVNDSAAATGVFTKRLISLMQLVMRRNGGGNSTSMNRGKLTDLYVSPEAMTDVRNWNVDQVDEITRREIHLSTNEDAITKLFGVMLHTLDELGEGQEYQLFYDNELSGTLPGTDVELVVGLNRSRRRSFVMPISNELEVYPDDTLHRLRRGGLYGWMEVGFGVLDNRDVLLGSM